MMAEGNLEEEEGEGVEEGKDLVETSVIFFLFCGYCG